MLEKKINRFSNKIKIQHELFSVIRQNPSVQIKRGNINKYITHRVSSEILKIGLFHKVRNFVFEDLWFTNIEAGTKYSYSLTENLFGQVLQKVKYKSFLFWV